MRDLVRGAVEAIAYVDRKLQLEEEEKQRQQLAHALQDQTRAAIAEVQANPDIAAPHKAQIISALTHTGHMAEVQRETSRVREQQLEVMSLLGIVAGFMTHEFGVALQELEQTQADLTQLATRIASISGFRQTASWNTSRSCGNSLPILLVIFMVHDLAPDKPYSVRPRLAQVRRIFGKYAEERNISIDITVEKDLDRPDGAGFSVQRDRIKPLYQCSQGCYRKDRRTPRHHSLSGME